MQGLLILLGKLLITAIILFLIHKLAIKPWIKLQYFKKQGIKTKFDFRIFGFFLTMLSDGKRQRDACRLFKKKVKENPDLIAEATNLGPDVLVSLYDRALLREFMIKHEKYYEKSVKFGDFFRLVLGNSLTFATGNPWLLRRKIISQAFHFNNLKLILPDLVSNTRDRIGSIIHRSATLQTLSFMKQLAAENSTLLIFGNTASNNAAKNENFIREIIGTIQGAVQIGISPVGTLLGSNFIRKGIFPSHRALMNRIKSVRKTAHQIIEDHKTRLSTDSKFNESCLLSILLSQNMLVMTNDEMVDEILGLFAASYDTTKNVLGMALFYLANNISALKRLREEIANLSRDIGIEFSHENISNMVYLDSIIKETLRMSTPAQILPPRESLCDHTLENLKIKKGTLVVPILTGNNFNEKYYQDPHIFKPERWLKSSKDSEKKSDLDSFIFTPFSAGQRSCIGQNFALIEIKIIIVTFVMAYDFQLDSNYRLREGIGISFGPLDEIEFSIQKL